MAKSNKPQDTNQGSPSAEGPRVGPDQRVPLFEIPERIGNYRIKRPLAQGGMGVIFLAEQQNPKRFVVIKTLRPDAVSDTLLGRFKSEAKALASLEHPFIAQIFEAGTYEGPAETQLPYMAMELVRKGRSLTVFAEIEQLDQRQRLELMLDVCDAVQHAHEEGIVHRDLKPSNILVDFKGRVRVLDFGIARFTTERAENHFVQTSTKEAVGTLRYMSPEQVPHSGREADARSDVYALGVILYELISRGFPYPIPASENVFDSICNLEPAPLTKVMKDVPKDVDTIVLKTLSKEPQRRYQSVGHLAADIRRYLNDEPVVARPPSSAYQLWKFAKRNRPVAVATLSIVLVLAIASVVSSAFAVSERVARNNEHAANRQTQLELARRATSDGSWQTAIEIYTALAKTGSLDFDARIALVDARVATLQIALAERELQELALQPGLAPTQRARVWLRQGDLTLAPDEATTHYEGSELPVSLAKIRMAYDLGLEGADENYAAALLAETAPAAVAHLKAALMNEPRHRRARELLVVHLLILGDVNEAEHEARVLDSLFPKNWTSKCLRGAVCARQGERDEAYRLLESIHGTVGDNDIEAVKAAIDILSEVESVLAQESPLEALPIVLRLSASWLRASKVSTSTPGTNQVTITPRTASFFGRMVSGIRFAAFGRDKEALAEFRAAATMYPTCETLACIGLVHRRNGDFEAAVAAFDDALARPGTDAAIRTALLNRIACGTAMWWRTDGPKKDSCRAQVIADIDRLRSKGPLSADELEECAQFAWQVRATVALGCIMHTLTLAPRHISRRWPTVNRRTHARSARMTPRKSL